VIAIDSVLVGSSYRKIWHINSYYSIYLIEGIGSTYGLKEPSPGFIMDAPGYTLTCFRQDGITLYPGTATSCNIIDGVKNISNQNIFNLFPNPATSAFNVESSKSKVESVEVYDVVGMKCFTPPLSKGKGMYVDVSSLSAGIYLVRVKTEYGSVTKKLIKQ
jgi:hypothetical protein